MLKLDSLLSSDDIKFLEEIGLKYPDKDFSEDEIKDIFFDVMDKLQDNLVDEIVAPDEFSKRCSAIMKKLHSF